MSPHDLDALITELERLLPGGPDDDPRPFWNKAREVRDGFRSGVRYDTRAGRDSAWGRLNELRDLARAAAARGGGASEKIDAAIHELAGLVEHGRSIFGGLELEILHHPLDHMLSTGAFVYDWKPVWKLAGEIQARFNEKPFYPNRSARDNAWTRFNDLRNEASRLANADREMRLFISQAWRDKIVGRAEDARYSKAWDEIQSTFLFNPTTVDEMKRLGQVLHSVGEILHDNKHQMLRQHKDECFARIQEIRQTHEAFWDRWRRALDERRKFHEARVADALVRMREHREKPRAITEGRGRAVTRRNSDRRSWDKIEHAWTAAAITRFTTWLNEARDRRDSIRESIQRAEAWIAQDEERRDDIYRRRR